ncbi:MAG TPA: chemotaxis protein CheA [Thermoanaerobaculia bacterium]|nr:chemotaxis protein CheA [Thermoanaerobaculia bacterium]
MADFDLNLDELRAVFAVEATENIDALERGLLALESEPEQPDVRHELLRVTHTLKGNASCVGLQAITTFAHVYEELLERVDERSIEIDGTLITQLLAGVDVLRRLLENSSDDNLTEEDREIAARIAAYCGSEVTAAPVLARAAEASTARPAGFRSLRVAEEKLNRMLNLVSEMTISRGRVREMLSNRAQIDVESLVEIERQIDLQQAELQELIMRARMVPVGPLFRQYARVVRDVAATHGKNARLVTIGEDVELDTTAVEALRDPLTHMIRNAIDHGIEPSPARVASGKPPVAQITLEARHEAGSIIIIVSDDGAGLNRAHIAERARTLGHDPDRLSDAELWRLIFEPGFSTAENVTDLSGRGVGMDVVRRSIEALRGSIAIDTREGERTTFTIRLPLTLAVIEGFGVQVGSETFIVPMENVLECLELKSASAESHDGATGVILLRDEVVPYIRLRSLFAIEGTPGARENVLIVSMSGRHNGMKAGLVVDQLNGAGQAVIKPLGKWFSDVPGIAGSSILGTGRVALILDTTTILNQVAAQAAAANA